MDYDMTITLNLPYDQAVPVVKQALADHGFGVLTEIDAKATMKEKLGQDMEPYLILGACNPPLAHRALTLDRQIGLLLPWNIVVRADGDHRSIVAALDPQVMVTVGGRDGLRPVVDEAGRRIRAARNILSS